MKLSLAFKAFLLPTIFVEAAAWCDPEAPQSMDGTCNNLANPLQGSSFTPYRRGPEGAEYEDGVQAPMTNRPPPRTVSNIIGNDDPAVAEEDEIPHNMLTVLFGQFINHDFENNDKEKLFVSRDEDPTVFAKDLIVPIDENDPFCYFAGRFRCFPLPDGKQYQIDYRKSAGSISSSTGQFEVDNRGTSYLDLGTVYGNTNANATVLRTFQDGKLLTSDYVSFTPPFPFYFSDLPPSRAETGLNTDTVNLGYSNDQILTHGDFRVNNNVALAAFHTLFTREHNYQADQYKQNNPGAPDEEIFQAARRRNIAQFQKIVLEDYLPAEFGYYFTDIVGTYSGYDENVDASTGAAFAGAAFRYGHSSIRGYKPLDECGQVSTKGPPGGNGELPFIGQTGGPFNILAVLVAAGNVGFETVLRGLVATRTRPIDAKIDDGIRNIPLPGSGGTDLGIDVFSLDMQRGRLNGVPNYNRLRAAYHPQGSIYGTDGCGEGLDALPNVEDPLACFIRLVSGKSPGQATDEETMLAEDLKRLYGKINKIDAFVGMLVEPHVMGSSFGETIGRIVADQYKRARDGDRFWYENVYDATEQTAVKQVTLKELLERNFELENLPQNVFFAPADFAGDLAQSCG